LPDTLAASNAKRGQCQQDPATAGDRQAGSTVDRLDRKTFPALATMPALRHWLTRDGRLTGRAVTL